jgi:hypothetical protein
MHMATYKEIQTDVYQACGKSIQTCWIAHVKELVGLPLRPAANRISSDKREKPCPEWARPIIEDSMRKLGML